MNRVILSAIVVILVLGGVIWYFMQGAPAPTPGEQEQPQEETPAPTSQGEVREFTVTGIPFEFSVKEMRVRRGDTVRVTFINEQGIHNWRVDEFGAATAVLQQGSQETIEFVADKVGQFEYYC